MQGARDTIQKWSWGDANQVVLFYTNEISIKGVLGIILPVISPSGDSQRVVEMRMADQSMRKSCACICGCILGGGSKRREDGFRHQAEQQGGVFVKCDQPEE